MARSIKLVGALVAALCVLLIGAGSAGAHPSRTGVCHQAAAAMTGTHDVSPTAHSDASPGALPCCRHGAEVSTTSVATFVPRPQSAGGGPLVVADPAPAALWRAASEHESLSGCPGPAGSVLRR